MLDSKNISISDYDEYDCCYIYINKHVPRKRLVEYDENTHIDIGSNNEIVGIEFINRMDEDQIEKKVNKIMKEYGNKNDEESAKVAKIVKESFIKISSR